MQIEMGDVFKWNDSVRDGIFSETHETRNKNIFFLRKGELKQ